MAAIYLIRHGQASFLKSDYDQLSDLGKKQSEILGRSLRERKQYPTLAVRGSLRRHRETAEACLWQNGGMVEMITNDRWNEYDHMELLRKHDSQFTDHEAIGQHLSNHSNPMKELQKILDASIHDWIQNKNEYHQSWPSFKQGVIDALQSLGSRLKKGEVAWVFSSGGPISVALIYLLSLEDHQFVELQGRLVNSSVTKVLVGKDNLRLSTYNEYSHLDHDANLITYR